MKGKRYKVEMKGKPDSKIVYAYSPQNIVDVYFSRKGKVYERTEDVNKADLKISLLDSRKSETYFRMKKKSEMEEEKRIRAFLDTFSYNVDDYGTLTIYTPNDEVLNEISDCNGLSEKKINDLVDEAIMESEYFQRNFK